METQQAYFKDYKLFSGHLEDIQLANKLLINTINQYSYCMAGMDKEFDTALKQSDILLPDGIAIVKATSFLSGNHVKKIAGADLHEYLLLQLNKAGGSCFYLGSSERTLAKIKERVKDRFPSVAVGTYSPPYKQEFSLEDNVAMREAVNEFQPDVLFIGLTAPKQEKWASANKQWLDTKLICSIGAVFDFYAGTIERPGKVWINMGMEWLIRLLKEPKRMWKRYLYYGPVFFYDICKMKMKTFPHAFHLTFDRAKKAPVFPN